MQLHFSFESLCARLFAALAPAPAASWVSEEGGPHGPRERLVRS